MKRTLLLALVVLVSLSPSGPVAASPSGGPETAPLLTATATDSTDASAGPTVVDSCTTIDEPGRYVLSSDLDVGRHADCIVVRADDVVLDGRGHRLDGPGVTEVQPDPADPSYAELVPPPTGVLVTGDDVAVTRLALSGWAPAVAVRGGDAAVTNVTATVDTWEGGVALAGVNGTVAESEFRVEDDRTSGILVGAGTEQTVRDNRLSLDGAGATGVEVTQVRPADPAGGRVAIRDNRVLLGGSGTTGVVVGAGDATVTGNEFTGVTGASGLAVRVWAGQPNATVRVERNRIRTSTGVSLRGSNDVAVRGNDLLTAAAGIDVSAANATISGNRLRGEDGAEVGVRIAGESDNRRPAVALTGNSIGDYRVGVAVRRGTDVGGVAVHDNAFDGGAAFGVRNENPEAVNATGNYWGASDGPASADDPDAPFADPRTGALADGSGDAVSESPTTPGVSNVCFDPFDETADASANETTP